MNRADLMARVATWLEEGRADDGGDPCRDLTIEHGVSAVPGETWTVRLDDTGAWAHGEGWEHNERDAWVAWGAGETLDEALAAALADLDRPTWGKPR